MLFYWWKFEMANIFDENTWQIFLVNQDKFMEKRIAVKSGFTQGKIPKKSVISPQNLLFYVKLDIWQRTNS